MKNTAIAIVTMAVFIVGLSAFFCLDWMSRVVLKNPDGSKTKDLKSLNKNSKFHFYFADNCVLGLSKLAYSNNLPDSRFDCTFITDGTSSYAQFNNMYNREGVNPQSRYDRMAGEWQLYVNSCRKGNPVDFRTLSFAGTSPTGGLDQYTTVAVGEAANVNWWVSRKSGTFASTDSAFLNKSLGCMIEMSMGNMLVSLQDSGKDAAFKE